MSFGSQRLLCIAASEYCNSSLLRTKVLLKAWGGETACQGSKSLLPGTSSPGTEHSLCQRLPSNHLGQGRPFKPLLVSGSGGVGCWYSPNLIQMAQQDMHLACLLKNQPLALSH